MEQQKNILKPFDFVESNIRGRVVRLDKEIDKIIGLHDYPDNVNETVSEAIVLSVLFASLFKFDGVFSMQIRAQDENAVIKSILCDVNSEGDIRACATYNESGTQILGEKGVAVFTVYQGDDKDDRYQGVVEIKGGTLIETVRHYFNQSEQIPTGLSVFAGKRDGVWMGGGIVLQEIAGGQKDNNAANDDTSDEAREAWNRAMVLMQTCTEDELLDHALSLDDVLLRLFHEEGVRVYPNMIYQHKCRCSAEKVDTVLRSFSPEERHDLTVEGKISVRCDFCGKKYDFAPDLF